MKVGSTGSVEEVVSEEDSVLEEDSELEVDSEDDSELEVDSVLELVSDDSELEVDSELDEEGTSEEVLDSEEGVDVDSSLDDSVLDEDSEDSSEEGMGEELDGLSPAPLQAARSIVRDKAKKGNFFIVGLLSLKDKRMIRGYGQISMICCYISKRRHRGLLKSRVNL